MANVKQHIIIYGNAINYANMRSWCNWKHVLSPKLWDTYVRFVEAAPICPVISAEEGFPYKEEVGGSNPPQGTTMV